ncbi:MAG: lipoprotein-releasing system transmembrane subunit LolC [Ponticaulis sp.]|nr:lipoprotein-releasing system transmembrane subunit LolC [Ponticaulis sp.]
MKEIDPSALKDRPFGSYERSLSFRYLRAKREHGGVAIVSILSLVGIALAVAALIIVMSIMNGFRAELVDRVLGNSGHIRIVSGQYPLDEVEQVITALEGRPNVQSAMPVVEGYVLTTNSGLARAAFVRGLKPEDAAKLPYLQSDLYSGTVEGFGEGKFGGNGVLVSERLARSLYIGSGDEITLVAPEGASTMGGVLPRRKVYTVQGVFQVFAGNANPLDDVLIIMPLEQSQLFFNFRDRYPILEVKLTDPQHVDVELQELRRTVLPPGIPTQTWKELYQGIVGALEVERSMMRLIFAVLITITALNIITGIVMLVKNKARDVAILRTMGATRSTVLRVFLMVGAILGTLGLAIGLALGLLVCFFIEPIQDFLNLVTGGAIWNPDVYGLPYIPALIDWFEVGFASFYALFVSVIVALLPAWNAARLDPVEALRSE